ncbi:hypothetical protein DPX16_2177 [Anabarilius grahami]|uniref:Uncharacterized protein n=1 Tax=Anabarilius grahami TaxID=495550 RepID=A0A3N0YF93_ANAGA|nr:hypothetical protein DPX16_2177 [Anabarilius grahami]
MHSAPQWSEDAIARLQGFACTDWEVFEGELDEQTEVITDYIKFCMDTLIPVKNIRTYPNSKQIICVSDPTTFATNLNHFYARFDASDFSAERNSILDSLPFRESLLIYFQLTKCKLNKAPGPDGITGPEINSYSSFSFSSISSYINDTGYMENINCYSCS